MLQGIEAQAGPAASREQGKGVAAPESCQSAAPHPLRCLRVILIKVTLRGWVGWGWLVGGEGGGGRETVRVRAGGRTGGGGGGGHKAGCKLEAGGDEGPARRRLTP